MIRHERRILPGVILGRQILSRSRADDAEVEALGGGRVRMTVHAYTGPEVEEGTLRPYVYW